MIWNDVFQAIVMLAGLVAIIVVGSNKVGGFANVWDIMEKGQRLKFMRYTQLNCNFMKESFPELPSCSTCIFHP